MQKDIIDMLAELEIEQIEEVQKRYKQRYPDDRQLIVKCQIAISMKKAQQKMEYFTSLIDEVKSAPDGAATPSQGNETR